MSEVIVAAPPVELERIALVNGEPMHAMPLDLYIPPEAMEVFLQAFSGPLDLLLYLIKRNNLDILDIPIAEITRQYVEYIELMTVIRLELAAEYLVMAATLAEIKSRMLLPRPASAEEEDDPRAELVRRLQEYEQIKNASEQLDQIPRLERDTFTVSVDLPDLNIDRPLPEVDLRELILAFKDVLRRVDLQTSHLIEREALSIRERMTIILDELNDVDFKPFVGFFKTSEGRSGLVVTFIAMLELIRESLIEMAQSEAFAPIYLRKAVYLSAS